MSSDEAEQRARTKLLRAGAGFLRAGQAAAWALVLYVLVEVGERVIH